MTEYRVALYRRVPPPGPDHPSGCDTLSSGLIRPQGGRVGVGSMTLQNKQVRETVRYDSRTLSDMYGSGDKGKVTRPHPLGDGHRYDPGRFT